MWRFSTWVAPSARLVHARASPELDLGVRVQIDGEAWRGRAWLARGGRLAAASHARSWGAELSRALGRGSGALGAAGGPARWPARRVGRRKVRRRREEREREMVGGEERKERKERKKKKKEKGRREKNIPGLARVFETRFCTDHVYEFSGRI